MFIVHLTYTAPLEAIDQHMAAHRVWVDAGFADGVFIASGPLTPRTGGAILAHGISRAELEARLAEDPFRKAGLIEVEVLDLAVRATDPRLDFLKAAAG